jgi:hypothetical protein
MVEFVFVFVETAVKNKVSLLIKKICGRERMSVGGRVIQLEGLWGLLHQQMVNRLFSKKAPAKKSGVK